jgi:hypothetical protein
MDDQDPGPTSETRAGKGRSPAEDVATPKQGQDVENPQYEPDDGDSFSTPTQEQQSNNHNMYIQSPTIIKDKIKTIIKKKKTRTHPRNQKKIM